MKHRSILVNHKDFLNYKEKYGSDKLDKWNSIYTKSKTKMLHDLGGIYEEEIFDGIETAYKIKKNNDNYIIIFNTISNTKYRFDLFKEPNENIYHLGFSLYDTKDEDYEKLTFKNEAIELLNKIIWILKDVVKSLPSDYELCIGLTDNEKKNKIYEYMMKTISNWEKRETDYYDTGWGIYFKLN